jgi:ribonucleoside-diphosphate reductase alpha chain
MRTIRLWPGVRMRQVMATPEPDAPARLVTIPADWDDAAAEALAALLPGTGALTLAASCAPWLSLLAQRARQAGEPTDIALAAIALLRRRRAAPNAAVWQGTGQPGFVINLGAFHDAELGFDVQGLGEAAWVAARACRLLAPDLPGYEIGLAGLDDLLAALGLNYTTRSARDVAACAAALVRARVSLALESQQRDLLATGADFPSPPPSCAVPGLAEQAAAWRAQLSVAPGAAKATGVFPPGLPEALLGVETGGIAPAFAPVRDGRLSRAAQDRLAARGMSPEAALALSLVGNDPLPAAAHEAHAAMHAAVAPYLHIMPAPPEALPAPLACAPARRAGPRPLPSRQTGLAQKASVGGHRVFLRTGEFDDGSLADLTIALPKENAAFRGLMECFASAVSIGLQHGVKLETFVDAFALTEFGPAGLVENDPAIAHATSVLDYVFRTLSVNYLGRALPEPEPQPEAPVAEGAPLLPLDLPRGASPRMRRRHFRIVA